MGEQFSAHGGMDRLLSSLSTWRAARARSTDAYDRGPALVAHALYIHLSEVDMSSTARQHQYHDRPLLVVPIGSHYAGSVALDNRQATTVVP
eukprot:8021646-Pyramimonas_sp.AAC.2